MITVPCETIVRLSNLFRHATDDNFRCLRFEDGVVVASDRSFMCVENLMTKFSGTFHVVIDDETLEHCRTEMAFNSTFTIVPNDAIKFTVGKTTLGYQTDNIGFYPEKTDLDRWREIFAQCDEPVEKNSGVMIWEAERVARFAASSPSGIIVFEEHHRVGERPILVRDAETSDWCGVFMPTIKDGKHHASATPPRWLK